MTEQELIQGCRKGEHQAQKLLYERYAPVLFGLARRYVKGTEDAEDVFVEGMFKILTKIDSYRDEGSFEGWMKRVIVNEALMFLRKNKNLHMTRDLDDVAFAIGEEPSIEATIYANEILELTDQLPDGYRTVFNLYVIEGYKHREIADMLGISINTSKSQLILARKRMRSLLKKSQITKTG